MEVLHLARHRDGEHRGSRRHRHRREGNVGARLRVLPRSLGAHLREPRGSQSPPVSGPGRRAHRDGAHRAREGESGVAKAPDCRESHGAFPASRTHGSRDNRGRAEDFLKFKAVSGKNWRCVFCKIITGQASFINFGLFRKVN